MRTLVLRTMVSVSLLAALWSIGNSGNPYVVGSSEGLQVRGGLEWCDTYFNTKQCTGTDSWQDCVYLGGQACEGNCTGHLCMGTMNRSYCNPNWAPELNALNCEMGPMTCGNKAYDTGTCETQLVWNPDWGETGRWELGGCYCSAMIPSTDPCPDTKVDDFEACCGKGIIAFYRPDNLDPHWINGTRIRESQLLALK